MGIKYAFQTAMRTSTLMRQHRLVITVMYRVLEDVYVRKIEIIALTGCEKIVLVLKRIHYRPELASCRV